MATVIGTDGNDTIIRGSASPGVVPPTGATNEADLIFTLDGADTVRAGAGNDTIFGQDGFDNLSGDTGNDTLNGDAGRDTLFGAEGNDTLEGGVGDDFLSGGDGGDRVDGDDGNDLLFGGRGNDTMNGGPGNDTLFGDDGNDQLFGGIGNDTFRGSFGSDRFTGGSGNDTFDFNLVEESPHGGRDTVFGVEGIGAPGGDLFDVSSIDVNTLISGNQNFTFIGAAPFSAAGQLRVADAGGGNTLIQGNVDGILAADLEILVVDSATDPGDYTAGDFIL